MDKEKGIYGIYNKANKKWYIGSTTQEKGFYKRLYKHKRDLIQNRHCNKRLQSDWNTYGENSFEFKILFEFPDDTHCLVDRKGVGFVEWCYVKNYNADNPAYGYNLTGGGLYGKRTKESAMGRKKPDKHRTHKQIIQDLQQLS